MSPDGAAPAAGGRGADPATALPPALLADLPRFAGPDALLAFDFDGTLAPIRRDPRAVELPLGTRERLERLARRRRCAVFSGRSVADLLPRLAGLRLAAVVGNHGAEEQAEPPDPSLRTRVEAWRERLEGRLSGRAGVLLEDKGWTLALHYRLAPDPEAAREAILAAVADLEGARVFGGHCVVNLVPVELPHKGHALQACAERLGCHAALYVGDDETDEDVFSHAAALPLPLLGIRIGAAPGTRAAHRLPDRPAVDALLDELLRLAG